MAKILQHVEEMKRALEDGSGADVHRSSFLANVIVHSLLHGLLFFIAFLERFVGGVRGVPCCSKHETVFPSEVS
jgi:hypothetical protein